MPEYQLQIKQVVDYPRCRIYRQFVHRLMADRSIRTSGGSGLFYFIEAAYIANIIVIHSRLAQRAETVDHTISILISTLQKPEAASEFPVDFAPIHC